MAGNLILPRCQIYWGTENLSLYSKGAFENNPQPLAFDATVQLQDSNSNPTGSFSWNPTGPAWEVYEKFVSSKAKIKEQIVIRFFYANGKSIPFVFVWSGQEFSYGNDMSVKIKLKTELDGFTNANIRSIAQAYDKDAKFLTAIEKTKKQYGVDDYKKLIRLSKQAEKDLTAATLKTYYAKDVTFGDAVSNLAEQNGNTIFANNIGQANNTILTPFSWEAKQKESAVVEAKTDLQLPDPTVRYGFLLGPGIIDRIDRTMEWVQPQATPQAASATQAKPVPKAPGKPNSTQQNPPASPQAKTEETAKPTTAPIGATTAKPNPGVQNADNKDGPTKQTLLQKEKGSTLSAQMFMAPVLVGIKPGDIVYVPSLQADNEKLFIEDWIVTSVSYTQSDGNISLSVSASRPYGLGNLINEKAGDYWRKKAASLKTLEDWGAYAWPASLQGLPAI
jgi:2-hydroxy-3-keto-5-methylthiopentenyl-1-phosphate phosphatase